MKNYMVFGVVLLMNMSQLVGAAGRPLKVYILAGQSNMEGKGDIKTFDYIGDDPATAPLLKEMRGSDGKQGKTNQMAHALRTKHKNHANKDGKMTDEQRKAWLKEYRAKLITPEEEALWKRGASSGGSGHYFGSTKFHAQIGKAFAEAMLILKESDRLSGPTSVEPRSFGRQYPRANEATKSVTYADGRLNNGVVSVAFDYKKGVFSVHDAHNEEVLLSGARFGLPSGKAPGSVKLMKVEDVLDALGIGKRIILEVEDRNLLRYYTPAKRLFSYTLYENNPALMFGFGLKTPNYISMRLMESKPLAGGRLFGGRNIDQPRQHETVGGTA